METPLAAPAPDAPSGPPIAGEPMIGEALVPPANAAASTGVWTPPPPPVASGPRGRARFGAGIVVGAAVTAAALGGYVVGLDAGDSPVADPAVATDAAVDTPADAPTDPAVEPVVTESGAIADLVAAARPSVVLVQQRTGGFGGSTGTGFVLSSDGYVVTNNHVVEGGDDTVVTFADGSTEAATIVAADRSRDLAVLQVARTDLQPLAVGDSDDLRLGDQLVAVGYALGLDGEPSVTSGILSARNRTITEPNGEQLVNLLQTDTAINPGNSGGPLLNMRGEVIGINTAVAGQAENIGFAIAITPVMDVIAELREGNVPARALMGVTTQLPEGARGAEIVEIAAGSGAAASSLRVGDVVTAVDDTEVTDPSSLGSAIARYQPGDEVSVTVDRNGTSVDVPVILGTRPT